MRISNIRKIVFSLLFALTAVLFTTSYVYAANKANKLVIHYFRYDENYTGFNVWLWEKEPGDLGGKQFDFKNDQIGDYGAYIEIDLNSEGYSETTLFGIIIKQGGWEGYREPGGDRFFSLSDMEVTNNTINAYLVEQDINIGLSQDDLDNGIPNYEAKILSSYFTKTNGITATFSHDVVSYKVLEENNILFQGSDIGKTLNIDLENINVDLQKPYTLEVTFESGTTTSRIISIQNLYDTESFADAFTYTGDLGLIYGEDKSTFRLWAPISESVVLNLYNQGHPNYDKLGNPSLENDPVQTVPLEKIENGAWEAVVSGDLVNMYYTFSVTNYGITNEVTDPYSYSTGVNGIRSMVIDFGQTNPENWSYNSRPNTITNLTDYIVYELHVRDLTTHSSWNGTEEYRGKFMGFTESGTTYETEDTLVSTGLDHIVELGVNAVQLLPIFDFGYIDEARLALEPSYNNKFNWGYMPYHFNTLEGSYATNPFDGNVRVNEFKQLVQSLHNNDIRVIMDVVYNHTGESETSNFHKIVPGYYHRLTDEGGFYNGSGTGNETASDRSMVSKFMVDSVKFLAEEYNLSGFRFDLMRLHDVDTMLEIERVLHEIDPTIVIYGEPWDAGGSPISEDIAAGKENIYRMGTVGAFNDNTRDAIKGSVFQANEGSWLQGNNPENHVENIKYGIAGGTDHPQVNVDKWHLSPERTINYVSAHDNNTLHDKLRLTGVSGIRLERMQVQANAMILTSQGIPFLHAGVEFLRSKPAVDGGFDENSYESPDEVNQMRWDRKARNNHIFEYYKALIQIRKHYPQFRYNDSDDVINNLTFLETTDASIIAYQINHPTLPSVVVIHNGNKVSLAQVTLPSGKTFRQLTSLDSFNLLDNSKLENSAFALMNTSVILIENKSKDNVSLKQDVVTINKGDSFNPLSNVNYNSNTQKVYTSSFYNTNVSGTYLITVLIVDSNGNFIPLNYNLVVSGGKFNFNIKGDVTL